MHTVWIKRDTSVNLGQFKDDHAKHHVNLSKSWEAEMTCKNPKKSLHAVNAFNKRLK